MKNSKIDMSIDEYHEAVKYLAKNIILNMRGAKLNKKYLEEYEKLKKATQEKRNVIIEKYKNNKAEGLDSDYKESRELNTVTKWFVKELDKLKEKYNI